MSVEWKMRLKSFARTAGAVLLTILANASASTTGARVRLV